MRVIAGSLGGRNFDSPRNNRTHPMSEKARGALFNALGDLSGLTVLDAFAGSGALSVEAVSRGASSVTAIDLDTDAYKTIAANVELLGLREQITPLRKNIAGWTRNNQQLQFDVVLADPPYDDIRPDILQNLALQTKPNGLFVISWPGHENIRTFEDVEQIDAKNYGDAQLVFYRRIT